MKRFILILFIITLFVFLSGCRVVNKTSQDILVHSLWKAETKNKMTATLAFDTEKSYASLKIKDEKGESFIIDGIFAVNDDSLIITSGSLYSSFLFEYVVYEDRLELSYNSALLVFERVK